MSGRSGWMDAVLKLETFDAASIMNGGRLGLTRASVMEDSDVAHATGGLANTTALHRLPWSPLQSLRSEPLFTLDADREIGVNRPGIGVNDAHSAVKIDFAHADIATGAAIRASAADLAALTHVNAIVAPPEPVAQEAAETPVTLAPSLPTDSLFASQYYLRNTAIGDRDLSLFRGDTSVWDEFTGSGVHIGIIDAGVDYNHVDLNNNYDATRHAVVGGVTIDGAPPGSDDNHGTAVAGIIAAERNGVGVVGIAYDAKITSMPAIAGADATISTANAIGNFAQFDVINNSWGFTVPNYDQPYNTALGEDHAALFDAIQYGRDGLGTIFVKSAGNGRGDYDNGNFSYLNSFEGSIAVAAIMRNGVISDYSTAGADILVSAFGGPVPGDIVTTDRTGSAGYSSGDYTSTFNGTSSAGPMIAGIAALMLEANSELGYRDVQAILGLTAQHTGSANGASVGQEQYAWELNHATNWNGGGMHYSEDYGYGLADALAAVRLAESWTEQSTVNNLATIHPTSSSLGTASRAITNGGTVSITFQVTDNISMEHVRLELGMSHNAMMDLTMELVSPDGTVSQLLQNEGGIDENNFYRTVTNYGAYDLSFSSNAFRGEESAGTWTLSIHDGADLTGTSGTLSRARLSLQGTTDVNDTYVFTEEYSDYNTTARRSLADTNGGNDTLNASAVFTASTIKLSAGENSRVDGVTFTTNGTFESAVTGDGNDRLYGNTARAGTLQGMRGDDTYFVDANDVVKEASGQGTDLVYASASYVLAASQSIEQLRTDAVSGTKAINLTGNGITQTIYGNNGINVLDGGTGGADTMTGYKGNDTYHVDGNDKVIEAADGGSDTVMARATFTLGTGQSVEYLRTITNAATTAINLTGNEIAQRILGNAGANIITGLGGADTIDGAAGADTFRYLAASDSSSTTHDLINNANFDTDKIDLHIARPLTLTTAASGPLNSGSGFNSSLAAAVNGALAVDGAVLFTANSSGTYHPADTKFLVVDVNHDGSYTGGVDYVFELFHSSGTLTTTDFI